MKHHIPFFLFLAFVLLVACGQSTETLPSQSIDQPTSNSYSITVTSNQSVHTGITVNSPAALTSTPIKPSRTPAFTYTPLPTNTPFPTGTPTPPGMAMLDPHLSHHVWTSPDKNWLWAYEYDDPTIDEKTGMVLYYTHLVTVDGEKEWKVGRLH